jgi:hypothetical protein
VADPKGVPVGYDLLGPKTGQERDAVLDLAAAHPGSVLFADGGFWGREYLSSMQFIDIELITPTRHKRSQRPAEEIAKAGIRLVIESVFATLKRQMGLQYHLAKTLPGLVTRIAQRLLALTLGIYLNPPRPTRPRPRRLRRTINPHRVSSGLAGPDRPAPLTQRTNCASLR